MRDVKRRAFPDTFKREAVDRVASSGLSAGAVARELGLHETVLRRWMMQCGAQATGTPRRPNTQAVAPSIQLPTPRPTSRSAACRRRAEVRVRMLGAPGRSLTKDPRLGGQAGGQSL
jgi:transposase-like protein